MDPTRHVTPPDPHDLPWPAPDHPELRDRLLAAYGGDRGYHDLQHLAEVLARIGELGAGDDVDLVLAAWFHDAVYDTIGDNEERSARLAEAALTEPMTIPGVDVAEVARLVRLTASHQPADDDVRGWQLCDADLAILAADRERYDAYVAGVRADYASVPDDQFHAGRLAVLRDLVGREHLFGTDHGRAHWEEPARANLRREIATLEALSGRPSGGAGPS